MYKIFLILLFGVVLNAELINGVAIVVKGEAITLHDLKKEMSVSKVDVGTAKDILIRKKLEEVEIRERRITIASSEVYEEIKEMAAKNNMNVSELYEAVRSSNGLSSSEFKQKTKERLLSKKLYSKIAYSSLKEPTDEEAKEYYELHKNNFSHPSAFNVVVYTSKDKKRLQEKINNPMFYAPDIKTKEESFKYDEISPELANFLQKAKLNTFTPIVPNGKGANMSFYIKEIKSVKEADFSTVKSQIMNMIMGDKREQVLSDYFARLKNNASIEIIRMPE